MDEAYYFGCWRGTGHFYWLPGMKSLPLHRKVWYADTPWQAKVDGCLTPGRRNQRGRLAYEAMSRPRQGEAALHHKDGWTALALHDFTVDRRPASNSVFFFHSVLTFQEAVDEATRLFPTVMTRIGNVLLMETHEETQ